MLETAIGYLNGTAECNAGSKMRVLFVTTEMADFVKVGGLGDISAALPRALRQQCDVRVLIPGYPQVLRKLKNLEVIRHLDGLAQIPGCELALGATEDKLKVFTVICPALFERSGGPYVDAQGLEWPDAHLRAARLSLAAAQLSMSPDVVWRPDILHANDWPTGLAPAYAKWMHSDVRSLFTIHNLAHQGLYDASSIAELGIPESAFCIDGVEFFGKISLIKAGISFSDYVTTVSETYAKEITTPSLGCGLEGLLQKRAEQGALVGILNGVDENWDPRFDQRLFNNFGPGDWTSKSRLAARTRKHFGMAVSRGPLFAVVSRLVEQKGIDLITGCAEDIVAAGGQLIITGTGDPKLESSVRSLMSRHPGMVGGRIGFDEAEARNVFAASDFYLMPSRFEPCGLSQMYAQRSASLPIASQVGGLTDTITDGVDGLLLRTPTRDALSGALFRAFGIFAQKQRLDSMRRKAMRRPLGWKDAGVAYLKLYRNALKRGGGAA